jgi:hypothetical protein
MKPKFTNVTDVLKQHVCRDRVCVWPIPNLSDPDDSICFIQLEFNKSSEHRFKPEYDKKVLDILANVMASVFERINVNNRIQGA